MEAETIYDRVRSGIRDTALERGDFVLASGERSSYYIDLKKAALAKSPLLSDMASLLVWKASQYDVSVLAGMELGAVPLLTAMQMRQVEMWRGPLRTEPWDRHLYDLAVVRKEAKDHGTGRPIETATSLEGKRCAVVEDVITTGGSTLRAVEALRDAGAVVIGVVAVVDRMGPPNGSHLHEFCRDNDIPRHEVLFNIRDILDE